MGFSHLTLSILTETLFRFLYASFYLSDAISHIIRR